MTRGDQSALAVTLGLAAAALLAGLTGLREFDVFHHLAVGRQLAAHGFARAEPFLYPLAGQATFPPPHWLGSLVLFAAEAAGGLAAVVLLIGLAGAVTFALAADDALTLPEPTGAPPAPGLARPLATLLVLALALGAWRLRAVARPEVLGLACFTWTLRALRRTSPRLLWSVPAVALLWSNLHPSVVFGLGAAALATLDALRDAVLASRGPERSAARARARRLVVVTLAACAAALLNPGGSVQLALAFLETLLLGAPADAGLQVAASQIVELMPPPAALLTTPAGALLALVPLGWILARRRPRFGEALLLLGLVLLSVRSVRFVPWGAVAVAPLAARDLATGVGRLATRFAPRRSARGLDLALALLGAGALAWSFTWLRLPLSLSVQEALFPVRAAELLAAALPQAPGARLWNPIEAGGYLEWRLPGTQLYQDGRLAFAPGEARGALEGPASRSLFAPLEARWAFDALVAGYPAIAEADLYALHGEDPAADRRRYALVGFDDGGLLYVRRDGALSALVAREYREAVPARPPAPAALADPARLATLVAEGRRAVSERPGCGVCRAGLWLSLLAAGDEAGAEAVLPGGRLPRPVNPFGHPGLQAVAAGARALAERLFQQGLARGGAGDLAGAAAAWRRSALASETGEARADLGLALLELGDAAGAARELGRAVALEPGLAAARLGLGRALEATGRRAEAAEAYRAFVGLEPGSPWAAEARQRAEALSR